MIHQSNRNQQIGNICIKWSSLEYHLAVAIWIMVGADMEVGKILTASLDAKQRANMAFALAHQINAPIPFKKAIKVVVDELRGGLIDLRNQAVHGIHFTIERPDAIGIEMHRGKGGREQRVQSDKELSSLGSHIRAVTHAFDLALAAYAEHKFGAILGQSQALSDLKTILSNISATNADGLANGPE